MRMKTDSQYSSLAARAQQHRSGDLSCNKPVRLRLPCAICLTFERIGKIKDQFAAPVGKNALDVGGGIIVLQHPVALHEFTGDASGCRLPVEHYFALSVVNRYTVIEWNFCPGFSSAPGNVGWLGESG